MPLRCFSLRITHYAVTMFTNTLTHVKISQLVAQICKQAVNKLCSHGLLQAVNKFGTRFKQLVTTLLLLSDLVKGCSNKAVTMI